MLCLLVDNIQVEIIVYSTLHGLYYNMPANSDIYLKYTKYN